MLRKKNLSPSETLSWRLIDYMLLILASSTIAYEITLFTRLPLWYLSPLFFFWFIVLFIFRYQLNKTQTTVFKLDNNTIILIILSILCSLINTFTLRPDPDDFSFFHRAIFDLMNLDAPISITHTAHDLTNLPALSPVHLTTSIEVASTFVANALGIQPMAFIHNGLGSLCLFIFPFILFTSFQYLQFSERLSLFGIIITIMLYVFSGDSHQDWGNFTIVRAWQGKTILVTLFVPLTALLTFNYLRFGNKIDLLRLNLSTVASLGLTGSAFFLIPFIVAFSALGSAFFQYKQSIFYKKSALLSSVLIPFALVFILIKLGTIPDVKNTDIWKLQYWGINTIWNDEITMLDRTLFVKKTTVYFYLSSFVFILLFYKNSPRVLSLLYSSIVICIALILPPISSILIKITLPFGYWRLAYATQMPFIITLAILLAVKSANKSHLSNRIDKKISNSNLIICQFLKKIDIHKLFTLCIFLGFVALKASTINSNTIAYPHKFKFHVNEIAAINLFEKWLPQGSVVLIPKELVSPLGLARPDIRMLSTQHFETFHTMLNAGYDRKEIDLRLEAQKDLITCGKEGKLKILLESFPKLSLLVFPINCSVNEITNNTGINQNNFSIKNTQDYQFWLKNT